MILRSVRDLFTEDVKELIVDSKPVYERLLYVHADLCTRAEKQGGLL